MLSVEVAAIIRQEVLGGFVGLTMGLIITSLWQFGRIGLPVVAAALGALMGLNLMAGAAARMFFEELTISAGVGATSGAVLAYAPSRVIAFIAGTLFAFVSIVGLGGISQPDWAVRAIVSVNSALSTPSTPFAFGGFTLLIGVLCAVFVNLCEVNSEKPGIGRR